MPSPRMLKDVQSMNGKLAEEAERALKDMKKQMTELPTLTAPIQGETLIMYLSVAKEVISVVLLVERVDKQIPMYFMGRALQLPEINYSSIEKLVLALVHAARRLRRYFQAHPVAVIKDQLIKQVLSRTENSEIPTEGTNQVEEAAAIANEAAAKV
ncbi:reverse transcriptase domain-containing protein [Tanacetum coccineum]